MSSNLAWQERNFTCQLQAEDKELIDDSSEANLAKQQLYLKYLSNWCMITKVLKRTKTFFVLQDRIYPEGYERGVTNVQIKMYNNLAGEYLSKNCPHVLVWSSGKALVDQFFAEFWLDLEDTNTLLTYETYMFQLQLLVNYLLNVNCQRD